MAEWYEAVPAAETSKSKDDWWSKAPPVDASRSEPTSSALEAGSRAMGEGLTAGFYKELKGLAEAGGSSPEQGLTLGIPGTPITTAIPDPRILYGAAKYAFGNEEAKKTYETAKKREEERYATMRKERPYTTMAGEIAGAVPTMLAVPELAALKGTGFAGRLAQGALSGAAYGGVSGASQGEGIKERALSSALGAGMGGLFGAGGTALGKGVEAAYERFGKPVVSTIRGWADAEGEAAKRVTAALKKDQELIQTGKAKGMTEEQWYAARDAGEPVTIADLGSTNTQALLRSAANTSPDGRAVIEKMIFDRFAGQSERVASDMRRLIVGGANKSKTADELKQLYDVERAPAYRKAFAEPAAQSLWTPELEQISQAPVVQEAIRKAMLSAQDEAAKLGLTPPKIPFIKNQEGRFILNPTSNLRPNLQFWDVVKKSLDEIGDREHQYWSKSLRNYLDNIVPAYKDARGVAAKYFGERDALTSGAEAVKSKMEPAELEKLMKVMSPVEKDLFREGYASQAAKDMLERTDTQDITKRFLATPMERQRFNIIFGQNAYEKMQARVEIEKFMDAARTALGNSTTARQLIEAGLAGGAIGGYLTGDIKGIAEGAAVGLGAKAGAASKAVAPLVSGAQKMIGYVDRKTASEVASLLMSENDDKIVKAIDMIAKDERLRKAFSSLTDKLVTSTGIKAAPDFAEEYGLRPLTIRK
jgi:hypothetical protein